jgi:hypothetical protein
MARKHRILQEKMKEDCKQQRCRFYACLAGYILRGKENKYEIKRKPGMRKLDKEKHERKKNWLERPQRMKPESTSKYFLLINRKEDVIQESQEKMAWILRTERDTVDDDNDDDEERITGFSDFMHRPDSKSLEEKHDVSETGLVSILR